MFARLGIAQSYIIILIRIQRPEDEAAITSTPGRAENPGQGAANVNMLRIAHKTVESCWVLQYMIVTSKRKEYF